VLRVGGFAILEAADGLDALRIAEATRQPIEILVTDINMPGLDGVELAQRVQARNLLFWLLPIMLLGTKM
jgi:YesN/AraC family two-component response regulator